MFPFPLLELFGRISVRPTIYYPVVSRTKQNQVFRRIQFLFCKSDFSSRPISTQRVNVTYLSNDKIIGFFSLWLNNMVVAFRIRAFVSAQSVQNF